MPKGGARDTNQSEADDGGYSNANGGDPIVNQRAKSGMDLGGNLNWEFQYTEGTVLLVR